MPGTEMVVMIAFFAAATLVVVHLLRLAGTMIAHRTIRKAIDRNPDAAETLITNMPETVVEQRDDRTAVLLIASGLAILAATIVIGESNWMRYGIAGAMFPLIIGAALWLRHAIRERAKNRDGGQ